MQTFCQKRKNSSSKDLFQAINKVTDNPVNMHIFSCHGGGALEDLNYLPDGSQAFSCCDSKNLLPGTDVERYFDKLNTVKLDNTNLSSIMNVYMASMKNRNSILRAEKGKAPVDLLNQMITSTGTPLQNHEIEIITQKLSHLFDKDTLDTVIQKYANKGEYNMFASEVGCAMAITQLLTESQQQDSQLKSLMQTDAKKQKKQLETIQIDLSSPARDQKSSGFEQQNFVYKNTITR